MKTSYFITATGTDLGKTWLTAGVLRALRADDAADRPVRALKPVMSGYAAATHADSDVGQLGMTPEELDAVAPWRFAAPLSPDRAAALEGKSIEFAALVDWCRREIERNEHLLLIEGIGGVMVPLDARHTVRDWIAALEIPAVLVCGSYLGALSHTLTALAALREVGVVPAHIVVNEAAESSVSLDDTLASLAPHTGGIPLHVLRRGREDDVARLAAALGGD